MYSLRFSAAVAVVAYIGLIMADRHGRVADPRWNLTAVNCYKGGTGFFGGRRERRQRKLLFVFCFQVTRPPRESLPFLDSLRTHSSAWDCAQLQYTSLLLLGASYWFCQCRRWSLPTVFIRTQSRNRSELEARGCGL